MDYLNQDLNNVHTLHLIALSPKVYYYIIVHTPHLPTRHVIDLLDKLGHWPRLSHILDLADCFRVVSFIGKPIDVEALLGSDSIYFDKNRWLDALTTY